MNDPRVPSTQKQRGWSSWSIVRKAQIIGAATGLVFTTGLMVYCAATPSASIFSFSGQLALLVFWVPLQTVRKITGLPLASFNSFPRAFFLALILNTVICFLLGSMIGLLVKLIKSHLSKRTRSSVKPYLLVVIVAFTFTLCLCTGHL